MAIVFPPKWLRRIGFTGLIFLYSCNCVQAENPGVKPQYLHAEIGGNGGLGSLSYEKEFREKEKLALAWKLGFSLAPVDRNNGTGLVFPLMLQVKTGKKSHHLEAGLGQGITVTTKLAWFVRGTALLGYRYENPQKHWVYRVSYTPLVSYLVDFQYQHWAGISIGYRIK